MPPMSEPISKQSKATPFSFSALAMATPEDPAPMMHTGSSGASAMWQGDPRRRQRRSRRATRSPSMPSSSARADVKPRGQACTMRCTCGSACHAIVPRPLPASPARSTAASIAAGVTDSEGRFRARVAPKTSVGSASSASIAFTTLRAEATGKRVRGSSGQIALRPLSGSRISEAMRSETLALPDPGWASTIGRRSARPSMKPRRE